MLGKIGIYGGSFNPPHKGHILAAKAFHQELKLDRLLLVPAALPPHKEMPDGSPDGEIRLQMLKLATEELPFVEVTDLELNREGPSYTVDTLRQLKKQYPGDQLFLCMGTDMLQSFSQWHQPEEICRMATLVMAHRVLPDHEELQRCVKEMETTYGVTPILIGNDALEISSTTVRRLLVLGGAEKYLQSRVLRYIQEHDLYGAGKNRKHLSFEELKAESLSLHKEKRVPHAIGCSETAAELARLYGVNEEDAARAGILHDVTKALDGVEQLHLCEKYGMMIDDFERQYTKLLHAVTGAAVAKYVFGENEAVCQAIRWHTSGRAGMTTLEKILYLADYIEPNRDFPQVEELRKLAREDLDRAMLMGLGMTVEHLKRQGQPLGYHSREAIEDLTAGKEQQ